jgi:hypothetical protein
MFSTIQNLDNQPEIGCIIKLKEPNDNKKKKFFKVQHHIINRINEEEKEGLNIFIEKLDILPEYVEKYKQTIMLSNQKAYIFKKDNWISFKEKTKENWITIVVTSEEVYEAFTNGLLKFTNPIILHGMFSIPSYEELCVPRNISTYGEIEHTPNIEYYDLYTNKLFVGEEYSVVDISSIIPNEKSFFSREKTNIFLHVIPKTGLKEEEGIYWYVDYKNLNICQYEDGCPIHKLGSIEIIKE